MKSLQTIRIGIVVLLLYLIHSCSLEEYPSEYLTASFEFVIDNNNYAPATVVFTNTSLYTDSYSWNFGDPGSGVNNTSTDKDPTHLYANPGVYTVSLTASNANSGESQELTKNITIEELITFEKIYELSNSQFTFNLVQNNTNGYAFAGVANLGTQNDALLIITDEYGVKTTSSPHYIGNSTEDDVVFDIILTEPGGYAMVGYTNNGTDNDVFLVITDQNGNLVSQKTFGGVDDQYGYGITENSDGGFALAGYVLNGTNRDIYLIITDQNGNFLDQKIFSESQDETGLSIVQTNNGGYAIFGYMDDSSEIEYYLILTDENLNELPGSPRTYTHTDADVANEIIKTDVGFALMGYTGSIFGGNIYVIFTDYNGNKLQEKIFTGQRSIMNFSFRGGIVFTGQGYAITGFLNNGVDDDVYFTLTDPSGNELPGFPKTFGESGDQTGSGVIQTSDGGYAIVGITDEATDIDPLLIKINSTGEIK